MYDFNINIGDTFVVKVPANWIGQFGTISSQPKIILTSTTTINVNSSNHKMYNFSHNGTLCNGIVKWIEGVGSTSGLLYNLNARPWSVCISYPAPYNIFLTCFSRNYYTYPYAGNGCVTGIRSNEQTPNSDIKVFPNPTIGSFTIQIYNFNEPIKNIFLSNTLGQNVLSLENPSNEISISSIGTGVYFITIIGANSTIIKKLIVE